VRRRASKHEVLLTREEEQTTKSLSCFCSFKEDVFDDRSDMPTLSSTIFYKSDKVRFWRLHRVRL
jgi:hypothetical protein